MFTLRPTLGGFLYGRTRKLAYTVGELLESILLESIKLRNAIILAPLLMRIGPLKFEQCSISNLVPFKHK